MSCANFCTRPPACGTSGTSSRRRGKPGTDQARVREPEAPALPRPEGWPLATGSRARRWRPGWRRSRPGSPAPPGPETSSRTSRPPRGDTAGSAEPRRVDGERVVPGRDRPRGRRPCGGARRVHRGLPRRAGILDTVVRGCGSGGEQQDQCASHAIRQYMRLACVGPLCYLRAAMKHPLRKSSSPPPAWGRGFSPPPRPSRRRCCPS